MWVTSGSWVPKFSSILKYNCTDSSPHFLFHNTHIFQFANPDFVIPISETVDNVIQNCPIDVRRPLYRNIVLSGGSTMFRDFGRRLGRDIRRVVDSRLKLSEELSGGRITVSLNEFKKKLKIKIL